MKGWPWTVSMLLHLSAGVGLAASWVAARPPAAPAQPVVLSVELSPEPPVRFTSSEVVFVEPRPPELAPSAPAVEPAAAEEVPAVREPEPLPRRLEPGLSPPTGAHRAAPRPPATRPMQPAAVPASTETGPVPPRPVAGNLPPGYPPAALQRGVEGLVLVRLEVGPDGRVRGAEVLESSGSPLLDEAALAALSRWRFAPGLRRGEPVPTTVDVPVAFRLREAG